MRVLIVEDDPMAALVLRRTLEEHGHEVVVATDGLEAWERIERDDIRLVISDWMMPRMDGLELCRRLRDRRQRAYTYVIVLTAKRQRQDRIEAMRAGADDLLTKPFDRGELRARTLVAERLLATQQELQARAHALETLRDELEGQNRRLAEMAVRDSLTGLKNRRHFHEVLEANYASAARRGLPLSLVMLDVDQFKAYNDSFGHPAGDAVLGDLAALLREHRREHDLVARYGGEEFVILLPSTAMAAAMAACERFRGLIERQRWRHRPITASFGVATLRPDTGDALQLIDEADQALYHAKRRGRNRVTHHDDLIASAVGCGAEWPLSVEG